MHISIFSQLYDKPHGCVVSAARKKTAAERCIENLSRNFAAIVSRRAQSVERKMRRIRGRRERRGRESSRGCSVHRPLSEIPPAVAPEIPCVCGAVLRRSELQFGRCTVLVPGVISYECSNDERVEQQTIQATLKPWLFVRSPNSRTHVAMAKTASSVPGMATRGSGARGMHPPRPGSEREGKPPTVGRVRSCRAPHRLPTSKSNSKDTSRN